MDGWLLEPLVNWCYYVGGCVSDGDGCDGGVGVLMLKDSSLDIPCLPCLYLIFNNNNNLSPSLNSPPPCTTLTWWGFPYLLFHLVQPRAIREATYTTRCNYTLHTNEIPYGFSIFLFVLKH
ncbi:hypothetical protein M0804_014425 [Polistes exclamans]|nr:hypothetical protein M0804_014426 [Polistes exclamans]KAI4475244.1 hypothetical protein M0804_014425 [Polistes exclamans]